MTGDKSKLIDFVSEEGGYVTFEDNNKGRIMEVNFKMSLLKIFVKKMEFTIIFLPQEHLNKMVLWSGKIDPLKKELVLF